MKKFLFSSLAAGVACLGALAAAYTSGTDPVPGDSPALSDPVSLTDNATENLLADAFLRADGNVIQAGTPIPSNGPQEKSGKWYAVNNSGANCSVSGNFRAQENDFTEGSGDAKFLLMRWESGNVDAIVTYPVTITQAGVYRFTYRTGTWNGSEANGVVPGQTLRTTFSDTPGYHVPGVYQSVYQKVKVLNSSDRNTTALETYEAYFTAPAPGTYYIGFKGGKAIFPIMDLSLTLDQEKQITPAPTFTLDRNVLRLQGEGKIYYYCQDLGVTSFTEASEITVPYNFQAKFDFFADNGGIRSSLVHTDFSTALPDAYAPVAPNMLANPGFGDAAIGWNSVSNDGEVTPDDATLTLTANGNNDNVAWQRVYLTGGKTYTFGVEYRNAGDKKAFAGLWNDMAVYESGNNNELAAAEDWTPYTITFTAKSSAYKSAVLGVNKSNTASYRNPWLIEHPALTFAEGVETGPGIITTGTEVAVEGQGAFDTYYRLGDGEEMRYTGPFKVTQTGNLEVYSLYNGIKVASVEALVVSSDEPVNLLSSAIPEVTANTVPAADSPWKAYNRAGTQITWPSNATFRPADTSCVNDPMTQSFLMLRWDSQHNVYFTYAIDLDGGYDYDFSAILYKWNSNNDSEQSKTEVKDEGHGVRFSFTEKPGYQTGSILKTEFTPTADWNYLSGEPDLATGHELKTTFSVPGTEKQTVYISFTGDHNLYALTEMSLIQAGRTDYKPAYDALVADVQQLLSDPEYINVSGGEREALIKAIEETGITDYQAAVDNLNLLIATFRAAAPYYDDWAGFLESLKDFDAEKYSYAKKSYIEELEQAAALKPESAAEAKEYYEKNSMLPRMIAESNALAEGLENSMAVDAIQNPVPAGTNSTTGWNRQEIESGYTTATIRTQTDQPAIDSNGTALSPYYDTNNYSTDKWGVNFNQTVYIASGTYRLSVFGRGSTGLETFELFGNDKSVELEHIGGTAGLFGNGWNIGYVDFTINDASTQAEGDTENRHLVKIGVRIKAGTTSNWASFTDFRLVRLSNSQTGINDVERRDVSEGTLYDLNGRVVRSENPEKGIYILVKDGKSRKIVIR